MNDKLGLDNFLEDDNNCFDDEEIEVDENNKLFHDNKQAIRKLREQIKSEDVFVNPIEDEDDDKWVRENLSNFNCE